VHLKFWLQNRLQSIFVSFLSECRFVNAIPAAMLESINENPREEAIPLHRSTAPIANEYAKP